MIMNLENARLAASSLLLRLKLRVHHVRFGYHLVGNYGVYIKNRGKIELGNKAYLFSKPEGHSCKTALITSNKDACITIGNHFMSRGAMIFASDRVTIGNDVMLAPDVIIADGEGHAVSADVETRWNGKPQIRPITIGNNVWISIGALVMNGVTIGDNSIIGARSVVTGNVPANVLYAGVPAKLIRTLA
jgi:acetyltransferase-like isoleucine patch superfamily enzyme